MMSHKTYLIIYIKLESVLVPINEISNPANHVVHLVQPKAEQEVTLFS